MQNVEAGVGPISALEAQAARAAQSGRADEAASLWQRIIELDPGHARALTALGQRAFQRGDLQSARATFQRLVDADGSDPQHWINLALACQHLKDEAGEESALQRALTLDPINLLERQGKTHRAALAYGAAANVSPPLARLHPDLRPAVTHALAYREKYDREFATFMEARLDPEFGQFASEKLQRFRDSVDILLNRKKRYISQSAVYHYPGLAPIEFFDRADFPWLDPIEAATEEIRDEFLALLASEEGFTPYITYPDGVPVNQFAELNNSPRWSAFHLYKGGKQVEENVARVPRTMRAMQGVPRPDQPGRTPAAMFSLLKPRTRIPPHNGVTNTRLVTHVALIIPDGCRFRVGNDIRVWVQGKAWVFDDTIEHEAWNDSDKLRVLLMFDIWHPQLTPPERAMITALTRCIQAFTGDTGDTDL